MSLEGHIHNGAVVFDEPVALPEGTKVRVEIVPAAASPVRQECTLLERLAPFVGILDDLPEDTSIHHDHYLYGTPKRT
jgi:hypothetical protein